MNNEKAINKMLILSERVRELMSMKQAILTLAGSKNFIKNNLANSFGEPCVEIDMRIFILKEEISKIFKNLVGYSPKYHLEINYISMRDFLKKEVDVSLYGEDRFVLNLTSGELECVVSQES